MYALIECVRAHAYYIIIACLLHYNYISRTCGQEHTFADYTLTYASRHTRTKDHIIHIIYTYISHFHTTRQHMQADVRAHSHAI
jgi:hypothetical protein